MLNHPLLVVVPTTIFKFSIVIFDRFILFRSNSRVLLPSSHHCFITTSSFQQQQQLQLQHPVIASKQTLRIKSIALFVVGLTLTTRWTNSFVQATTTTTNFDRSKSLSSSTIFNNNTVIQKRSIMTTHDNNNNNQDDSTTGIWDGSNKELFDSLEHPGYTITSDPITYVGGWLAHRANMNEEDDDNIYDWIQTEIVPHITKFDYSTMPIGRPPNILVLYGSLRSSSFSKQLAYEMARLLEVVGCNVRVFNPMGLPIRNPDHDGEHHIKVQEIRALTHWSDGHVWVSPEMHGTITGVFKNQIDWIPLNTGSVRPTQGKTCCIAQVNGGSQSFNAVNVLRLLARYMRMPCCTNQSSVPKAWQEFDTNTGRMKPSDYRNRIVDVVEEFAKFTAVMVPVSNQLTNRYSERMEQMKEGRLLTQEEKEKQKTINEARKA